MRVIESGDDESGYAFLNGVGGGELRAVVGAERAGDGGTGVA